MNLTNHKIIKPYIENGFKVYPSNKEAAAFLLQKAIYDDNDMEHPIKYHVSINVFDFRPYNVDEKNEVGLDADVQFNLKSGETINIELLDVDSPEQVVDFFEKIFNLLDVKNYENDV